MSYLASEYNWNDALAQLLGKQLSTASKIHSTKKGKEKRCREDDIPPEPTPDMLHHILELQQHLLCATHSRPGKKLIKKVTKFIRPNVKPFDHPATKKPRTAHVLLEVHVSINITPTLGAGSSKVKATYVPSRSVSPTPSPSGPKVTPTQGGSPTVQVMDMVSGPLSPSPNLSVPAQPNSNTLPAAVPIVPAPKPIVPAPEPIVPTPESIVPIPMEVVHPSLLIVLLDTLGTLTMPSLMDVLLLMDTHHPISPRHVGLHEELAEMGIEDVVDLYSLPVELLATFGWGCLAQRMANPLETLLMWFKCGLMKQAHQRRLRESR
ncbi:hypothetical protein H4582DRAFT_2063956 [Lactarius indigo]|nr:hypothetical protein H4582DRAFT_2063956 [Lactarius indigo]